MKPQPSTIQPSLDRRIAITILLNCICAAVISAAWNVSSRFLEVMRT